MTVTSRGDRPIQVGSHYPFAQTNRALDFDRAAASGMHLDIPAGTAVRFEPGETRTVTLVENSRSAPLPSETAADPSPPHVGLGTSIVDALARQLNAQIAIDSTAYGTSVVVAHAA